MAHTRPAPLAACAAVLIVSICLGSVTPATATPYGQQLGTDRGTVEVRIHSVELHAGATVEVRMTGCCGDRSAIARSEAFVEEVPLGQAAGDLGGEASVSSALAPGIQPEEVSSVSSDGTAEAGSARVLVADETEPTTEGERTRPVNGSGDGPAGQHGEGAEHSWRTRRAMPPACSPGRRRRARGNAARHGPERRQPGSVPTR